VRAAARRPPCPALSHTTLQFGYNELPEKKKSKIMQFLGYLWGPMPCMIWVAIIIELAKASLVGEGWEDFGVLMFLQFANATVGY
jgi:H+-transporting ATPase